MGDGSPYAPHGREETAAMLEEIGVAGADELFDIPAPIRYEGTFDIDQRDERTVRREIEDLLARNDDLVEFLGRGHYEHYVPAVVDDLAGRSEFLTSYTQYQPEVAQGFLQALFEYQSMLVELTGMDVANCSTYDAATALGEAATLSQRVRTVSGDRILIPAHLQEGKRAVLDNYASGTDGSVEPYPMADGATDHDALADTIDEDVAMVYAENPTVRGVIQPDLAAIGDLAHDHDALFCVGSDPIALALLESPGALGADVVVGDASTLGVGAAYGLGLGLFATREEYLRQVPGRLVGASEDASGRRAYTLTLQTREQHIRRERATSNICTNQAWLALRAAMHAAWLGPDGLLELAEDSVTRARDLAQRLDDLSGVTAPVHDRHHVREFVARTDQPAPGISQALAAEGYAVHVIDDHLIQLCVTETTEHATDALLAAFEEVA